MAGVNLSEESARILATNSELVGTLTRSCKDDTFLLPAPLQRRILEIGMRIPRSHRPGVGCVLPLTVALISSPVSVWPPLACLAAWAVQGAWWAGGETRM